MTTAYLLDVLKTIANTANDGLKYANVTDERTERERVIDELINEIDPNTMDGNKMISYLKRNRSGSPGNS